MPARSPLLPRLRLCPPGRASWGFCGVSRGQFDLPLTSAWKLKCAPARVCVSPSPWGPASRREGGAEDLAEVALRQVGPAGRG